MIKSAHTLYILGNGFDRVHGLESSYLDFKEWLRRYDVRLLDEIEAVWQNDSDMWCDFEQSLGVVNPGYFMRKFREKDSSVVLKHPYDPYLEDAPDEASMASRYEENARIILENSMSQDFYPSEFHCIGSYLKPLVDRVVGAFNMWVSKLDADVRRLKPLIPLHRDALFVSFNYTGTLENLYGVPRNSILYIHGRANTGDRIMFGHNKSSLQIENDLDNLYSRIGYENIAEYSNWIRFLSKDVESNLRRRARFFERMSEVDEINIFGFSFSDVDMDYIYHVVNETSANSPHFNISYFSERDRDRIHRFVTSYGLSENDCSLLRLEDLFV